MKRLQEEDQEQIALYKNSGIVVLTEQTADGFYYPFTTTVQHPQFPIQSKNKAIRCAVYGTKEEAKTGHAHWVQLLTSRSLPDTLEFVPGNPDEEAAIDRGILQQFVSKIVIH